jgi:hypothetical protein
MNDINAERRRLHEELQAVDQEFREAWYGVVGGWQFSLGPFKIERKIGSGTIARVYVIFNAACFVTGIVFVPLGGTVSTIGVALIVGALFSFGAFVSQFWTVVTQQELDMSERICTDDAQFVKFRELDARRTELLQRLDRLNSNESPRSD